MLSECTKLLKMLQINTTQNVTLNFDLASVGFRIIAFVLDLILIIAYTWLVFYFYDINSLSEIYDDHWSKTAISIIFFLPVVVYTLLSEVLMNGQTLGKKLMKLKVIKIDGFQASNSDFIISWFFRLVDIYGFMIMIVLVSGFSELLGGGFFNVLLSIVLFLSPVAGFITIIASKNKQRFGDMIAGTAVVNLKNSTNISHTIIEDLNDDYIPTYPWVIKLSDNDARIIKETFVIAKKNKDYSVLIKLRTKIEEVTGIENKEKNDIVFLDKIMKDYNYYTQKM